MPAQTEDNADENRRRTTEIADWDSKLYVVFTWYAYTLPLSLDRQQKLSILIPLSLILIPLSLVLHSISVDQEMLFEIILAANYLDIKPLLDVGCKTVANMIKGKTPEEIRKVRSSSFFVFRTFLFRSTDARPFSYPTLSFAFSLPIPRSIFARPLRHVAISLALYSPHTLYRFRPCRIHSPALLLSLILNVSFSSLSSSSRFRPASALSATQLFNIQNDFTPEEEAQIKKENEWAEDR
jgi:hypothetical protein